MSLESAIEGGFWNVAGAFNSVFNVSTASSWYAMQSATNWNSGNVFAAVGQDIAGGYIGMVTGITSSPAQQWWASGGSVALSFVTGGASTAAQIVMAAPVASLATQMAVQAQPVSLINSLQLLTGAMGTGLGVAANVFKPIIPTVFTTQSLNTFVFSMGVNTLNHIWGIGGNIGSAIDAVGASYAAGIEHGTISPQVGGVLFDKCASVATSIGELTAAYWDEPTKSLVLLGRSDGQGGRVSIPLPKMDRQLLFAALRAVLSNQALGVSIDPPAEHRHGGKNGKMLPDGYPLIVSYMGASSGTLAGAIMFEADRLMKSLSLGIHNETKVLCRAKVPSFRSSWEMGRNSRSNVKLISNRFWFEIAVVELLKDTSSNAVMFGNTQVKVSNKTEVGGVDPNADAFAEDLTRHYEDYAKEFPVLSRLKELAKVSALAQYLVNQNVSIDVGNIFKEQLIPVKTPETTSGRLLSETIAEGNSSRTRSMFGGVTLRVRPRIIVAPNGDVGRLRATFTAARPVGAVEWTVPPQLGNGTNKAKAIPLGKCSNHQRICEDVKAPINGHLSHRSIRRIYDASDTTRSDFGPGWRVWLPFSLTIERPDGKKRETLTPEELTAHNTEIELLVVRDHSRHESNIFRKIESKGIKNHVFARVTKQTAKRWDDSGDDSFEYNPEDTLQAVESGYVIDNKGKRFLFDAEGNLIEIQKGHTSLTRYVWKNHQIVSMDFCDGNCFIFERDNDTGRVLRIISTKLLESSYEYDQIGFLRSVSRNKAIQESYGYDSNGRLAEVRNSSGMISERRFYSTTGDVAGTAEDTVVLASGEKLTRIFNNNRLLSVVDDLGARAEYSYGSKGDIEAISITTRSGCSWHLKYDQSGNFSNILCGPMIKGSLSTLKTDSIDNPKGSGLKFSKNFQSRHNDSDLPNPEKLPASESRTKHTPDTIVRPTPKRAQKSPNKWRVMEPGIMRNKNSIGTVQISQNADETQVAFQFEFA